MILKLAWRNLWRNKRRTLITLAAIGFAVMLCISMRALQIGTYAVNIRTVVELFAGHLQLQHPEFASNHTLQKSVRYDPELRRQLDEQELVLAYTPRIEGAGLVSFGDNSIGAGLIGIDPHSEARVSNLLSKVGEGRQIRGGESGEIVVGDKLLKNLAAATGDDVVVLAQGFDGSLGNLKFRVVGTFRTGMADFDRSMVVMSFEDMQELLAMYGRVSSVAVRLNELASIPAAKSALTGELADQGVAVLDWKEVLPEFAQTIELDNVSNLLFLIILIVVVAFGIMNTILMSVTERFREFGVSLAIGMPHGLLIRQVFLETVLMALIGLAAGNLVAAGINYYIVLNPIMLGGEFAELYQEYGFVPRIESTMDPGIFLTMTAWTFGITLFACVYPILKVFTLQPLKGIRYT